MPVFIYRAVDKAGKMATGELMAGTKEEAVQALTSGGFSPLLVEEKRAALNKASRNLLEARGRVPAIEKILFSRHLAVILQSGIGLTEALDILIGDVKHPVLRKILVESRQSVEQGEQLSTVFARHPQHFSPVFVGMVRAGEMSGTLDAAFDNISTQLFREYDLLRRVHAAMIYPAILLAGSGGVITLLMTFVLPRMAKAFSGAFSELPAITRFFISVSDALSANPIVTIGTFVGLIGGGFLFLRSSAGRSMFFSFLQKLPVSSDLLKKFALARFARTFRNLLNSGTGAVEAMDMCAATVGNPLYQHSLMRAVADLKKGANLSDTFKQDPNLYPTFFSSIMLVGERTGTLEKSLMTLSNFYDEEVDRLLRNLVSLIEPILIFVMGIVVAFVALAVLLPIFQVVRRLQ